MKKLIASISLGALIVFFGVHTVRASTTLGTIDPNNTGNFKALFLDADAVDGNVGINFGKFTTQSVYNVTVSATELRGYAWAEGAGWIVLNCQDTTNGCSSTNGNFKVVNDGAGLLSGYAWGEGTGWINFGPFTNTAVSRVKIGTDGMFGGSLGTSGYAWTENYGWIQFDCSVTDACVETDWRAATTPDPSSGGGGGSSTPSTPTQPPVTTPVQPVQTTVPREPSRLSVSGPTKSPIIAPEPIFETVPQTPVSRVGEIVDAAKEKCSADFIAALFGFCFWWWWVVLIILYLTYRYITDKDKRDK